MSYYNVRYPSFEVLYLILKLYIFKNTLAYLRLLHYLYFNFS